MKNPNEPSAVSAPMSMPCICGTATAQQAAAMAKVTAIQRVWTPYVLSATRTSCSLRCGRASSSRLVEMCGQGPELPVPVAGEGGKELLSQLHGGGLEPVTPPAAFTRLGGDQAGQLEC